MGRLEINIHSSTSLKNFPCVPASQAFPLSVKSETQRLLVEIDCHV